MLLLEADVSPLSLSQTSLEIRFQDRNLVSGNLHSPLMTNEYSFRPRLNAVKYHIMADYLQTILFIGIYVTAVAIINPVELAREFSHVRIRVGHG